MTTRADRLYDEERPLPYLVQLVRVDGASLRPSYVSSSTMTPALIHLDLRAGEFARATTYRLAKTFDWLVRAYRIKRTEIDEHVLLITPLPPREGQVVTGERIPYVPEDWPDLRNRSFQWVPVAFDQPEEQYAWQKW